MTTYFNTTIELDDPSGRFQNDEELSVVLRYDSQEKVFYVRVPEAKAAEAKAEKPKPVKLFEGVLTGVKATLKTNGNPMLSWIVGKPALIRELGRAKCDAEVSAALDKVWETLLGNA